MLGLTLREEFQNDYHLVEDTAVQIVNAKNTGAIQIPVEQFLNITYPTQSLIESIRAVTSDQGKPIVIIGEKGYGKSHSIAALYHIIRNTKESIVWLDNWQKSIDLSSNERIKESLTLFGRKDIVVICSDLCHQHYRYIWDIIFLHHPNGELIRNKWELTRTPVPQSHLILELLHNTPVVLLLDGFQTWYVGLTNSKQHLWKQWASSFVRLLLEISRQYPDLLTLAFSVQNIETDDYKQIHPYEPICIKLKTSSDKDSQKDRWSALLHRLFTNRLQISESEIEKVVNTHVNEHFRLLNIPLPQQTHKRKEFIQLWPYAPSLVKLLETRLQEKNGGPDLVSILAAIFRNHGWHVPVLTAADFWVESSDGVVTLEALATTLSEHGRDTSGTFRRSITSASRVKANHTLTHLKEVASSLWLRSIGSSIETSPAWIEANVIQADCTRNDLINDDEFRLALARIRRCSFSINQQDTHFTFNGGQSCQEELLICVNNDHLFTDGTDVRQLEKEIQFVVSGGGAEGSHAAHVTVLPDSWFSESWSLTETRKAEGEQDLLVESEELDDRPRIFVLPRYPSEIQDCLSNWMDRHIQRKRNVTRFLLPSVTLRQSLFQDRDLITLARAESKALEWWLQGDSSCEILFRLYERTLHDKLRLYLNQFLVINSYDQVAPMRCTFNVRHIEEGYDRSLGIAHEIERLIAKEVFSTASFEEFILESAAKYSSLGDILRDLQDFHYVGRPCIPWLGRSAVKEQLFRLCMEGKVIIDSHGTQFVSSHLGEDVDVTRRRLYHELGDADGNRFSAALLLPITEASSVNEEENTARNSGESLSVSKSEEAGVASFPFLDSGVIIAKELDQHLRRLGVTSTTDVSDVMVQLLDATTGMHVKDLLSRLPENTRFKLLLCKPKQ